MFRSSTIIRQLALNLAKVIFTIKHSVKLCRYLLCGCVAACQGMVCVLYAVQNATQSHSATPQPLYPRERHGRHCIGVWVGPRAGLDEYGKFHAHRDSISGSVTIYKNIIPKTE